VHGASEELFDFGQRHVDAGFGEGKDFAHPYPDEHIIAASLSGK
jgi:hypothetical protein